MDGQSRSHNRTGYSFQSRRKRSQSHNRHYGDKQGKSSRKCGKKVDMLLTNIWREEKPATLADILVMFVDQTLRVPCPLWKVMNSPMKQRVCLRGKPSRKQEASNMPAAN